MVSLISDIIQAPNVICPTPRATSTTSHKLMALTKHPYDSCLVFPLKSSLFSPLFDKLFGAYQENDLRRDW